MQTESVIECVASYVQDKVRPGTSRKGAPGHEWCFAKEDMGLGVSGAAVG